MPDNLMPNTISPRMARDNTNSNTECLTGRSCQKSNYELFNCNLDVVAVSQAPSPKSCPNNSLPVKAMVVQYTTIQS